jgi:hypothetical protein
MKYANVERFEVIDYREPDNYGPRGRVFSATNVTVDWAYAEHGHVLKICITDADGYAVVDLTESSE